MNIVRTGVVSGLLGTLLVAACQGKLVVGDGRDAGVCSSEARCLATGGTSGDIRASAGGLRERPDGAICYTGPEPEASGGITGTGGVQMGVSPTCPLDDQAFATVPLANICDGTITYSQNAYPCTPSTDLLRGLECDEVTTDRDGFTRTVGCGFETVEFHSYVSRTPFQLEHEYAASYDLTTGTLSGVVIKEPWQFGPCMAYGYKAGTPPPDCPSAITYRCSRILAGDANDAAYAGCRSFSDPGCSRCCGIAPSGACAISTGQFDYDEEHACPCNCRPCAKCSFEQERQMRVTAAPPHAECNCSLPPMGAPCESWCSFVMYKNSTCPGL